MEEKKIVKVDLQSLKEAILRLLVEINIPVDENGVDIADVTVYKGDKDKVTYRQKHFKWRFMDKVVWIPVSAHHQGLFVGNRCASY